MLLHSTSNRQLNGAFRVHNWRFVPGWTIKEGFPEEVMIELSWKEEKEFADNERELDSIYRPQNILHILLYLILTWNLTHLLRFNYKPEEE